MNFLILRVLQHSELGMFHAYRRDGREGSKQRAINFDGDVVDRVFPAAEDGDRIDLTLRYDTDAGIRTANQWLKRQGKNWRLEGNCPRDVLYDFVEPGCLFAFDVEAGITPGKGAWMVFPKDDRTALAVLSDGSTSGLLNAGMIALAPHESIRVRRLLAASRSDMFSPPPSSSGTAPMTDSAESLPVAAPGDKPRRKLPPNAERLADMLGDAGHRLPSAVADIVDNSIEAGATEIDITFPPPNGGHGRWMVIRDNGDGMNSATLDEALTIGSDTAYGARSLGKYGYGLKGASWSQARAVTVVTRQAGNDPIHLGWDKLDMADFSVIDDPLEDWEAEATAITTKGTAVLWKHMKIPLAATPAKGVSPHTNEIMDLTRHLELVFHRFLEGEAKGRPPLTIRINGTPIEPNGPASHPLSKPYDAKVVQVPLGTSVANVGVQPFLLPSEEALSAYHAAEGSEAANRAKDRIGYGGRRNETQGLFIYRHDRLIKHGGWHDIWKTNDEKAKLARVVVEFDKALDEAFQINISKQEVSLPGFLQEEIKKLADPVRKESFAKYRQPKAAPAPSPPGPGPVPPGAPAPTPPTATPGPTGGPGATPPPAPPTPPPPALKIRSTTTRKFAWQAATSFSGPILQISTVSPGLAELARIIENHPEAVVALAAFLEELDEIDVQSSLVEETSEA